MKLLRYSCLLCFFCHVFCVFNMIVKAVVCFAKVSNKMHKLFNEYNINYYSVLPAIKNAVYQESCQYYIDKRH